MTHIYGQHDNDLHDEDGNHIKPVYQAPREQMPSNPDHSRVTGPVISGHDVERAEADYRSAMVRYNHHLDLHQETS